jgi:hypothetical protein
MTFLVIFSLSRSHSITTPQHVLSGISVATLGGPPAAFTVKFGATVEISYTGVEIYRARTAGSYFMIYLSDGDGKDGVVHVDTIYLKPAPWTSERWDDATAKQFYGLFLPRDAIYLRDQQTLNGVDHLYQSGALAKTFQADYFTISGTQTLVPTGTLHVLCASVPQGAPDYNLCTMGIGEASR